MNVIASLEFELAYYYYAVHRFNHYTTRMGMKNILFNAKLADDGNYSILGFSFYNINVIQNQIESSM